MVVQFRPAVFHSTGGSLVDDLFGGIVSRGWDYERAALLPLDVVENGNELVVLAEVPGVTKEDLKVTLHDGVLTISGEKKQPALPDEAQRHRTERESGAFSRSLELPSAVNGSAVSAELKDGILRVVIPKAEEARTREIRVN